jgi:hypothetical protein
LPSRRTGVYANAGAAVFKGGGCEFNSCYAYSIPSSSTGSSAWL